MRFQHVFWTICFLALSACQYEAIHQNGQSGAGGPNGGASVGSGVPACGGDPGIPDFAEVTAQVFRPHCFGCHSSTFAAAGLNLENYQQARALAPLIESTIVTDRMPRPPAPPLPGDLKALVQAWVAGGAPETSLSPGACPDSGEVADGDPQVPLPPNPIEPVPNFPLDRELSYAFVRDEVLSIRCVACHGGGFGADGVNLDSYGAVLNHLRDLREVIESNEMPPRPRPPLDERERYIVLRWIQIGAPETGE